MQVYGSILPGALAVARLLPRQTAKGPQVALSQAAKHRLKVLGWYHAHGANVSRTAHHFGHSRVTIQSWLRRYRARGLAGLEDRSRRPRNVRKPTWSGALEERVRDLREQYPRWGKEKLAVLLRREGVTASVSMVGRILRRLRETGRLVEPPPERRRRRTNRPPRPYAIRKPKGYLARAPGDLVEVDTLDLRPLPGVLLKHFTARDVVSRWDVLDVFTRATANAAARFLDRLQERMPFPVKAIQVDGGSEFKAEFEAACQARGIRLFVLPPSSPKLNGCVERGNRTHREEFYEVYDLDWTVSGLRPDLLRWERIYNTIRPHRALGYLTPQEFVTQWRSQRAGKEVVHRIT